MNEETKTYRLPKRKDGIKTFKSIIKSAEILFSTIGFNTTSVNNITQKANIATGTFYIYFDDKLAVYKYLIEYYGKNIRTYIRKSIEGLNTRYEQEREGLKAFLMYAIKNPICYKIFWEAMYVDSNLFRDYYLNFARDYKNSLAKWQIKNQIRKDINIENASYILMGISNFIGLKILFHEIKSENEVNKIVDDCMNILNSGIFEKNN